jgi:hypothetical protein
MCVIDLFRNLPQALELGQALAPALAQPLVLELVQEPELLQVLGPVQVLQQAQVMV